MGWAAPETGDSPAAIHERLVEETWQEAVRWNSGLDISALAGSHREIVINTWRKAEKDISVSPAGSINGLDVVVETFRATLAACGSNDEDLARRCFDYYWSRRTGVFSAFDDAVPALESLGPRCKLAVITNGPCVTQRDKLEVLGLDRYFDLIVCSGDVGAAKPDAAIFRHVLERLGAGPEATVHVGDNLMADVAGANGAGLTSVWLNRTGHVPGPEDAVPAYEIASLSELEAIVRARRQTAGRVSLDA